LKKNKEKTKENHILIWILSEYGGYSSLFSCVRLREIIREESTEKLVSDES